MGRKPAGCRTVSEFAGESDLIIALEDIEGELAVEETTTDKTGKTRKVRSQPRRARRQDRRSSPLAREAGKYYGSRVLAEGLAELFPNRSSHVARDRARAHLHRPPQHRRLVAEKRPPNTRSATGKTKRINRHPTRLRSAVRASARVDVMLGSALGVGSYRALVEEGLDGQHGLHQRATRHALRAFKELINRRRGHRGAVRPTGQRFSSSRSVSGAPIK